MKFLNRTEAGALLAEQLKKYKGKDVVIYALPRGGVVTAREIARELNAPLDLIITRKISHPYSPEYAVAATAENGHIIGNRRELMAIDEDWLEMEIENQRREAARRRRKYLGGRGSIPPEGKIAILVDDGVATGLTLRVGIIELRHHRPKKLIVAVPIVPRSTAHILRKEVDELVALHIPSEDTFLGAVGAYYEDFSQVTDREVIDMLKEHEAWLKRGDGKFLASVENGRLGSDIIDYDEP